MSEPMQIWVEVWPVAADSAGIWLVSGSDAWRADLPVMGDSEPHFDVELELSGHGVKNDVALLHSTSWRADGPRVLLTYVALLQVPGGSLVRDRWPDALPIGPGLADAVGAPPTNPPAEAPMPRYIDVLLHAVRHLRFLLDTDGAARTVMDDHWRRHLEDFTPALAGMYGARRWPADAA